MITAGEQMVFCDQVSRMNRRSKPERRDLVITDQAMYLVMRQKKDNIIYYRVKSRTPLSAIKQVRRIFASCFFKAWLTKMVTLR